MGKIGYSSVTLTDLTETLPVTLVLETSLEQNIQTKVGNLYTPNFIEEELIITPSLFLGQEDLEIHKNEIFVVPNERQDGYIYYQIGDIENNEEINYYYGSTAESSEVWVDKQGKLHIKRNLTKNLTVEANITNFYLPEHDYHVPKVSEVTPLNILLLEAGSSEYSAIITSSGREYFDEGNTEAITLTALLYKGATPLESGVSYKWDIMTDKDTPDTEEDDGGFNSSDFISREQSITVTRDKVHNTEIFICNMSLTDGSGLTFIANKILRDFSDEYSNNLFASSSTILNPKKLSVEITNQVRWQTEIINGEAANQNRFKYEWSILSKEGEQIDLTDDSYKNKTIEIVAGQGKFPKEDFTVLGKVTIDNKVTSFSYINIIYRETIYTVELSPKTFFIPVDSTGKITAPFSKEFSFKLLDENKKPVPFEVGDDKISLNKKNEDTTSISLIEGSNSFWEDSYLFNLDINYINNNFLERDDPLPYEFSYQYLGQPFQEEINIVKVFKGPQGIQGEQGSQGFSGYTIDLSNEFHAFSGGEGHADPDQSTSCKISAYYGSEGRTIQSIKLGDQVIYQLNTDSSLVTYHSSDYGYLYIQARKEQDHIVELTIRTNDSTTEAGNFLKGIRPLSFNVTILNTKDEKLVFPKVFTYTINYNGKSYSLVPNHNFIKYFEAEGTYEPSSITVSATIRQESGESVTYSGAKILYSFDGDNWRNYTTSGISGYANLQNIYLRLYSSQATFSSIPTSEEISNNAKYLLDMETIPILTSLEGYQFGGENLLRWSKEMPVEINKWLQSHDVQKESDDDFGVFKIGANYGEIYAPMLPFKEEMINNHLTFSCYVKVADWSNFGGVTFLFCINENFVYNGTIRQTSGEVYLGGSGFNHPSEHGKATIERINNKWCKFIWTFKVVDGHPNNGGFFEYPSSGAISVNQAKYCTIGIIETGNDTGSGIQVKKMKLEYGNIATEWSASPYDVTYGDLVGANLITSNSLSYSLDNTQSSVDSYLTLAPILQPNSYYTLSWKKIQRLKNQSIEYGLFSNNNYSSLGRSTLINEEEIIFQTQNLEAQLYFLIPSGEQLIFTNLKLEKGQYSSSYILTESELNERFENSKKYTTDELAKLQIPGFIPETITEQITIPDPENPGKTKETTMSYIAYRVTDTNNNSILLASLTDLKDYVKNLKNEINENGATLTSTKQGLIETQNGLSIIEGRIQLNNDDPSDPYLLISTAQEGNIISMQLHNNELGFYNGNTRVAYFSSQKLYITQADITTTLRIGTSTAEGGQGYLVFTTVKETGVTVTWSNT